jgi:aconitate hydratase
MGCIGMGQAPASNTISLRTMPRNFPGRSGTADDQVYLCSPETAAVSALKGEITDPRNYGNEMEYPVFKEPEKAAVNRMMLIPPKENGEDVELKKGPNIKTLPDFEKIEDAFSAKIILKMADNISTDEILKAGAEVLPLRSNIEAISKYAYQALDKNFYDKAKEVQKSVGGHIVVAGENYAQGSSREHAAIAPRYLGQKAVVAKSYARIGFQNLVNFGIIPFVFENRDDYEKLKEDSLIEFKNIHDAIENNKPAMAIIKTSKEEIELKCHLTKQQKRVLLEGGLINLLQQRNNRTNN